MAEGDAIAGRQLRRVALVCLLCVHAACGASTPTPPKLKTPPAIPVDVRIPVGPLGFMPPNPSWQSYRVPSATIDFVDDTHLLFTFHKAALMHRLEQEPDDDEDQTITALLLELPTGKVVEEAAWRLHDKSRYLWALSNGRFLERERNNLYLIDKSLKARVPYLKAGGTMHALQVSPDGGTAMVEYEEKVSAKAAPEQAATTTATGPFTPTLGDVPRRPRHTLRMLAVDTHENKVDKIAEPIDPLPLPLVAGGYLDVQPDKGHQWKAMLMSFAAAPRVVTTLTSNCQPVLQPLNERVFLAELCIPYTTDHLMQAYNLEGKKLWEQQWQARYVWGNYLSAEDGSRFAFESIQLDHPVATLDPVDEKSITGQMVGIFDVLDGTLRLVAVADPVMSAGQNYALSADGQRFAVLRAGAIEVYKLPPAGR